MNITSLSPKQLRTAANIQEKILELQSELADLLGSEPSTTTVVAGSGKRRFSGQAIANIRAGAKRRWAKEGKATAAHKPKKKMSAAGKKALSKALKARWAKAKASGKNAL
jgi:hypothetical protein